jgi:hypothetical protein
VRRSVPLFSSPLTDTSSNRNILLVDENALPEGEGEATVNLQIHQIVERIGKILPSVHSITTVAASKVPREDIDPTPGIGDVYETIQCVLSEVDGVSKWIALPRKRSKSGVLEESDWEDCVSDDEDEEE